MKPEIGAPLYFPGTEYGTNGPASTGPSMTQALGHVIKNAFAGPASVEYFTGTGSAGWGFTGK